MLPEQGCAPAPLPVPFISLDPHTPQAHQVFSASIGLFLPLPQTPPPPPHRAKVHHIALNPSSPRTSPVITLLHCVKTLPRTCHDTYLALCTHCPVWQTFSH